jgi:hypothetical protein
MRIRHRWCGTGAVAMVIVMASACGEPPTAPTGTPDSGTGGLSSGVHAACEVTSIDGERLAPATQEHDANVGQTIKFTVRVTADPGNILAVPPYTYTWSSVGPAPLLTGRETTNSSESAIQHVFGQPGSATIKVEVSARGGLVADDDACRITVKARSTF